MPVYKGKKRGTWRVVVWSQGQPHERVVHGRKADAVRIESALRLELDAGVAASRAVPTLWDYCLDVYGPHARTALGETTYDRRRFILAQLMESLGDLRLDRIGQSEVEAYQDDRLREGLSPVSVNNETRVLKRIINHARERYTLPAPEWTPLKEPQRAVKAFTRDEVRRILSACQSDSPALYWIVRAMAETGMRCGEVRWLPWQHVDLHARVIRIWPHDLEGGWQAKNRRRREVPIPRGLMGYLSCEPADPVWVFPSSRGGRRQTWSKNAWRRVTRIAGVDGGVHRLRHSYATEFLLAGGTIGELAAVLGHSAARTTEIYRHVLADHVEGARDRVSFD